LPAATEDFRDYQAIVWARNVWLKASWKGFTDLRGTDNHLILIDLTDIGINGAEAQDVLERAGITVNKNSIPFDRLPPSKASGIRVGTPAVSTRSMGPDEMKLIGTLISKVLTNPGDEDMIARIKTQVAELCDRFPLYPTR
jgi:glycine hydroxymethyltransferase